MVGSNLRQPGLLKPAPLWFIVASFAAAFAFNTLPFGRDWLVPDLTALVLVFWGIYQPRRVGMGVAWGLGLLTDIHNAGILGEHALAYTVLYFCALSLSRRLLSFNAYTQALHVLPLLALAQLLSMVIRLFMGARFPGFEILLECVFTAVLWPIARMFLLAPQWLTVGHDDNRPL